jgi:peptide/nickel transport system substrate-binding protein
LLVPDQENIAYEAIMEAAQRTERRIRPMKKRRSSMRLTVLLVFAAVLSACSAERSAGTLDEAADQQMERAQADDHPADIDGSLTKDRSEDAKESPFLQDKNLPPLAERLPEVPKVANELPEDYLTPEIGVYGGTLRTARLDASNDSAVFIIQNEPLVNSPGVLGEAITPNIVQDYQVSEDQRTFTFTLRKGMKWSDGHPLTMEDVKFAVEDVLFNEELTPSFPLWLKSGASEDGKPFTFTAVDEYTFQIRFDKPYGGFLIQLAVQGWRGYTDLIKPKHYLEKYHIKYTPLEELEPLIAEAGFGKGEWTQLFGLMDVLNSEITYPQAIGFPVLSPYVMVSHGDKIVFERNPYYFKVDAAGNQLPYIDRIESTWVQDLEMLNLKILSGEIDHSYEYATVQKAPLLKENEQKGGYKLYINSLHRTANDIHLNLTYDDPVWRQVVRDVRFRKALNLALDKQEISDTLFLGFSKPAEIQGTERDLEEANRLLDEMGLAKGRNGFRNGPDGKPFVIPFEISTANADFAPLAELITEQWKEIGIQVTVKSIDSALWGTRNSANALQATIQFTPGPVQWARHEWGQNIWAPLWEQWWSSGGTKGEEPPQEVKDLFQSIFQLRELSLDEALKKRDDIKKSFAENYWYFIHTQDIPAPVAVNAKIGNISEAGWGIAQNFAGEQWFFKP